MYQEKFAGYQTAKATYDSFVERRLSSGISIGELEEMARDSSPQSSVLLNKKGRISADSYRTQLLDYVDRKYAKDLAEKLQMVAEVIG
ncbi:hypothetical protein [Legionella hackeliae]|uniref:Uncharacterized protein n=1 Tax=Legionella hackeliae TaxID=449 RepID=A0A0A8UVK4_LEGHA|nr:hypothetical protein [Legionella hackeliae]KTD13148.1 hypothetical protein Lhac_1017 [Legionella hackeliae]CEK11541.1 protein of unknown function [Legionella hackeliae]STX48312.1 Uncharacterised protein [Legionella hackeliae]